MSVEEFTVPALRLTISHVKEAVRLVLHTIVTCRSIGGHRPIEPRAVLSELLDLTYMRTDEQDCEQVLEQAVRQFSEICEDNLTHSGRSQLILAFYTTQSRKQGLWGLLVGGEEKAVFERWRLSVVLDQPRSGQYSCPAEHLREEADAQTSASQQVEQALHFVIGRASSRTEHLPPPLQTQSAYRFQVSFSPSDTRGQLSGSKLSQGLGIPYLA